MQKYKDRTEAGKILAQNLKDYAFRKDALVLALPRGGVPVAYQVSSALHLPLDVLIVRKIGLPSHQEFAIGAIASNEVCILNQAVINEFNIPQTEIDKVIAAEKQELKRREKKYRKDKPFPILQNQYVILIDDGIATGATMQAAIQALRKMQVARIIVAVPVAASDSIEKMQKLADKIICPRVDENFYAVGAYYEDFEQTTDEEVIQLLNN